MASIPYTAAGSPVVYQSAAGGGDHFNAGSGRLHIRNAGGSPITVTVHSQVNCNQGFPHDTAYVIGNGTDEILGPFDANRYADGTNQVQLTYSAVTSVTVAIIA